MPEIGKLLIYAGLLLVVAGVLVGLIVRIPWLGRLPGDIIIKRENFSFSMPLATSLLLSFIISLVAWLFRR